MINFSSLACLEVCGSGVRVWCGLAVVTMSNLNPSYIEFELGLGYDNSYNLWLFYRLAHPVTDRVNLSLADHQSVRFFTHTHTLARTHKATLKSKIDCFSFTIYYISSFS